MFLDVQVKDLRIVYSLPMATQLNVAPLTKKFLQHSHLFAVHVKQPKLALLTSLKGLDEANNSVNFLPLLKASLKAPLGKIWLASSSLSIILRYFF